jgi:hypothetical protein
MKRNVFLLFAVLLTLTFAGNALAGRNKPQLVFKLHLALAQVVPPLELVTEMKGTAKITFDAGMRSVRVFMKIDNNISGVTDIHLHLGVAGAGDGVNEIVVTVIELDPPLMDEDFTVLEKFIRTETVDSVNNITSLYQAVQDGRVYLDVHTVALPDGVIRGQIFPGW